MSSDGTVGTSHRGYRRGDPGDLRLPRGFYPWTRSRPQGLKSIKTKKRSSTEQVAIFVFDRMQRNELRKGLLLCRVGVPRKSSLQPLLKSARAPMISAFSRRRYGLSIVTFADKIRHAGQLGLVVSVETPLLAPFCTPHQWPTFPEWVPDLLERRDLVHCISQNMSARGVLGTRCVVTRSPCGETYASARDADCVGHVILHEWDVFSEELHLRLLAEGRMSKEVVRTATVMAHRCPRAEQKITSGRVAFGFADFLNTSMTPTLAGTNMICGEASVVAALRHESPWRACWASHHS